MTGGHATGILFPAEPEIGLAITPLSELQDRLERIEVSWSDAVATIFDGASRDISSALKAFLRLRPPLGGRDLGPVSRGSSFFEATECQPAAQDRAGSRDPAQSSFSCSVYVMVRRRSIKWK